MEHHFFGGLEQPINKAIHLPYYYVHKATRERVKF